MPTESVFMPEQKTLMLGDGRAVKIRRLPIRAMKDAQGTMMAFLGLLSQSEGEDPQAFLARVMEQGPERLVDVCASGVEGLTRDELMDLDLETVATLAAEVAQANSVARVLRDTAKKMLGQPGE